ncbi:MAG: alpha-L-arabinofuranosidase [Sphingobacteriales bacterium]|nr:alpha-L-arabinofuranosidase [Sphingobacteriales bacterium]
MPFNKAFAKGTDSVFLFAYTKDENVSRNPVCFAWSRNQEEWFSIGNEYGFLSSDFGSWGSEKKIFSPFLFRDKNIVWHCVWSVNNYDQYIAVATSKDLINWESQIYPKLKHEALKPIVQAEGGSYIVKFANTQNKKFSITTTDFKKFSDPVELESSQYKYDIAIVRLPNRIASGQIYKVPWEIVQNLQDEVHKRERLNQLYGETTKGDSSRFVELKPFEVKLKLQPEKAKPISNLLIGAFFEDINYAADGGLYAELVQNRGFEYSLIDKRYTDSNWNNSFSWSLIGKGSKFVIDSINPLHENNKHYARINTISSGAKLVNKGFDGITIKMGAQYNFSIFAKQLENAKQTIRITLVSANGDELAKSVLKISSLQWKKYTAVLIAKSSASGAKLQIEPLSTGTLHLDMISLFPMQTFKNRQNGLRNDLATAIANLKPKFIRFPGGCVAHGDGIANIYNWKNSIGNLEARKPQRNLWGYHQSMGLGYYEYFQFCEDLGAEPLPVVAAGVPCQNSDTGGPGQQGGIPMNEMGTYIQDILDLVEWANGDINTKWGKIRAQAGHPKPFNLKFIAVGNEDLISDVFEERFSMIFKTLKKKHPEITVIGTVGPFYEGSDYTEGWKLADKLKVPMVDEHYYVAPGWMIYNQDFYDKYDREKSKVYLGEYASHLPGRLSNIETALSEALFLTAVERNADVVQMVSYAPLLAKERHTQWSPDLVYFNNDEIKPTVSYYVQQLYGIHSGTQYIPVSISFPNNELAVKNRVGYSIVKDEKTGDIIIKMVNMLPIEVISTFDFSDIPLTGNGTKTILKGNPASSTERPVVESYVYRDNEVLPPYSFTVLRFKPKQGLF